MSIIDFQLLPRTATVNDAGVLSIGGVTVAAMAEQFGTPLYVYDEEHLRNRCREAVAAFGKDRVIYATKAFLCGAMARLANEEGLLLDVATGGELFAALHAGVPGERCVLHGNNKSMEELRAAITARVQHIVVDSFHELDRIEKLHSEGLPAPRVQLRITPGVHVDTHDYVATGQDDSKFGFNLNNGDAMLAIQRAQASAAVELVGIHCHIGSNVLSVANFADACAVMVNLFLSVDVPELTLGGGLGVAYTNGETAPSMSEWADVLKRATSAIPAEKKVFVEPGRSIVATAGLTVYEVGTVKSIEGIRTYVSVDGGMSDNPRPMMYASAYEAFDPARTSANRTEHVRIVGKHCESGDIVINDALVAPNIQPGDLLVTPVTGAYGHSMASNYNKVPRPAVVFVANGVAREVVRRETLEDLVRFDI
ncbi:diaminopimelate decarboxylase [freshwater metagenome]|uniref:Diaminopimelate decarboxylase n=1 Tax=freshwater metagenome TaxID=449393 RepID=A0A094PWN8_9ZZZZ